MKKRIMAIVSMILCITSLLSCVGCSEDIGDESDTSAQVATWEGSLELPTEKIEEEPTEKQTEKKTTSKNTTKRTTVKATDPIPGKSTTTTALTAKTYTFANMSTTNQAYFKFLGRTKVSSEGLVFDTSCATLEFQGYMTGDVFVEINSKNGGYGFSYYTVYVDGKRSDTRFKVEKGATTKLKVASFTGNYFHTIKVVKQTEFKWALATVKSVSITGYLTKAPENAKYYIEFLGDSLTTGYGNIGKPGDSPGDSPKFQDGTKSYAYLAAESLGADYSMISRSAAGISQCWSNSPIIDYYKKFSKDRNGDAFDTSKARKPDLIVLHLGANDYNVGGSNKSNFVTKGKELVNYFRSIYGTDVPIIWAYDPGEGFPDKVKEIMNSFGGEAKGYYTLSLAWSERGADGHPSANEHAKHAKLLADLVKTKNILK